MKVQQYTRQFGRSGWKRKINYIRNYASPAKGSWVTSSKNSKHKAPPVFSVHHLRRKLHGSLVASSLDVDHGAKKHGTLSPQLPKTTQFVNSNYSRRMQRVNQSLNHVCFWSQTLCS